jgi:hypothetical protein
MYLTVSNELLCVRVGIPVAGVTFNVFPTALVSGQIVNCNSSWSQGTDVIVTANITSNESALFQPISFSWVWSEENYVSSYGAMSAQFGQALVACGMYIVTLTTFNEISSVQESFQLSLVLLSKSVLLQQ